MAHVRKPMTMCGLAFSRAGEGGRAKVIAIDGVKLTYQWPCGYERTEVFTQGVGKLKRPADVAVVKFFARYWTQGVTYECPRCRRAALKKKKEEEKR